MTTTTGQANPLPLYGWRVGGARPWPARVLLGLDTGRQLDIEVSDGASEQLSELQSQLVDSRGRAAGADEELRARQVARGLEQALSQPLQLVDAHRHRDGLAVSQHLHIGSLPNVRHWGRRR